MALIVAILFVSSWAPVGIIAWSNRPYALDLASHFIPYATLFACAGGLGMLVAGRRRIAGAAGLGAAVTTFAIALSTGWFGSDAPDASPDAAIRVVVYNAFGEASRGDASLEQWLLEQNADLVCMIDPPFRFPERSDELSKAYPHRITPQPGLWWKIILLSRTPMETLPSIEGSEHRFSFIAHRSVSVTTESGSHVLFSATHPPSPRTRESWDRSLEVAAQNGAVVRALSARDTPIVIAGDFNSTPLGRVHRTFARESGLKTWEAIFGAGTWPAWAPPMAGLPIDRLWVSEAIRIDSVRVGPRFQSDHRPVVVDLTAPASTEAPS